MRELLGGIPYAIGVPNGNLTTQLARGMLAGALGTAVLSLAYRAERRLRHRHVGPLDYDDATVPGWIVLHDLHLRDAGSAEEAHAGLILRWVYGSAFGVAHNLLRRRLPEPAATVLFGSVLMAATFTLFPILGHTPPPWRWARDVLATSIITHTLYAATVGYADNVPSLRSASLLLATVTGQDLAKDADGRRASSSGWHRTG
jgi:hypothetical protein